MEIPPSIETIDPVEVVNFESKTNCAAVSSTSAKELIGDICFVCSILSGENLCPHSVNKRPGQTA